MYQPSQTREYNATFLVVKGLEEVVYTFNAHQSDNIEDIVDSYGKKLSELHECTVICIGVPKQYIPTKENSIRRIERQDISNNFTHIMANM